ncbi:hypothetical protein [Cryobacterium sp. GrIS_2_6]|uniref:hypothetical protein n=1 Tax=Cryobacterium sp. GrIS_2_6 TaxID=3162785 RepID=UPI002E099154|nr:hypothetical protein [Cryobacterium psychrotolerans]
MASIETSPESWWDATRTEVFRLLSGLEDKSLAGMYKLAIDLMAHDPDEGLERARLSSVGHSFREILNNLPEALNDVPGVPARGHDDGNSAKLLAAQIEDVLQTQGAPNLDASGSETDVRNLSAPGAFFDAMNQFATEHKEVSKRVARRDSASVLGRVDPQDPALKPWTAARAFFMRRTHLNVGQTTKKSSTIPSDAEFKLHISNIEASLIARLGAFFDTVKSLEDILDVANRRHPQTEDRGVSSQSNGFDQPTTSQVHAALARLTSLQLRRAFYSKLANPLWVAPLHAEGAFSNPPAIERLDDGSYRVDPWPEIDYLVKMASLAPEEVVIALKNAANTDNPWVRRGIWEAATSLPASCAALLAPEMQGWVQESLGNSRTDPRDISRVIVILLEGGEHKKGARLADAFYEPRAPRENPEFGLPEPTSGIESYWYADTLPGISAALGAARLRTLRKWLEKYQLGSKSFDPQTNEDTSYVWRPYATGGSAHHAHEIGDALVDAVHSAALEAATSAPASLDTLFKSAQPLLRRIAIDVLSEALIAERIKVDGDQATELRRSELIARAAAVLTDVSFVENAYRPEFVKLIRASAQWGTAIDMAPLMATIEEGPPALLDERRGRLSREGDTPEETEARIQNYFQNWQHVLLSAIGRDSLTSPFADLLNELDYARGVIEHPNEPAWQVQSFSGPTSPLDAEQVKKMSDDELLAQLASWHPDPSEWAGPTHEGQGRAVTESFTTQSGRLASRADEIKALRPTYVRAILRGWELAHESGGDLPWHEVVAICIWAVDLNDNAVVLSEGDDFDDDVNYRNLKFQALQLLESGLNRGNKPEGSPIPVGEIPAVESALTMLVAHSEPSVEYEAKHGGDNMDPLTVSLNTIRPMALRSLIKLVHRDGESASVPTALATLEAHIGDADHSLAVAAVYGEGLGRLYDSVKDWTLDHIEEMFGTEKSVTPKQQVAFSTALAVHSYHPALLNTLRVPILAALRQLSSGDQITGWKGMRSFDQLIGDWILLGFVTGSIELDDELMIEWLRCTGAELRGNVLGHLGWQMMHWTEVDKTVLQRAMEFWDSRVAHVKATPADAAELSDFYWFIRSGKIEAVWWLPRLLDVVALVRDFRPRGMLGEPLAEAGSHDPDTALAILERLMNGAGPDDQVSRYDLYENAIPQVLAAALDAGLPALTKRANDLMNQLGAAGFIDVLDRVKSRRISGS